MKKNFILFATLICCLLTFSACGSDDEPKTQVTATAEYTIKFSPDFFKMVKHVNIYYKGTNGENKNDVMTSGTEWKKTITTTKFPAELAYKIVAEPKDDEDIANLAEANYEITVDGYMSMSLDKETFKYNNQQTMMSKTGDKATVLQWLKSNKEKSYGYRLTKDGTPSPYTPVF